MSAAKEKARLAKRMQSLAGASEATRALQLLRNTGDSFTTADTVLKLKALLPKARLPLARRYTDPHDDDGGATLTQQPALAQSEHGQYPQTGNPAHPAQHGGPDQQPPEGNPRRHTNYKDFKPHIANNLAKHPKLAGTGPLATAYEHLEGIADTGDFLDLYADALYNWTHGDVHEDIITLHLSGLLPAKQEATGGVRPLVAGSVHRRIAMRAILAVHRGPHRAPWPRAIWHGRASSSGKDVPLCGVSRARAR